MPDSVFDFAQINARLREIEGGRNALEGALERPFTIYFDPLEVVIRGQEDVLGRLVMAIKGSRGAIVEVRGYTDCHGPHGRNMQLGAERAVMVKHKLVFAGIESERVYLFSKGPPTAKDPVREDWCNRRVEVIITQPD